MRTGKNSKTQSLKTCMLMSNLPISSYVIFSESQPFWALTDLLLKHLYLTDEETKVPLSSNILTRAEVQFVGPFPTGVLTYSNRA